MLYYSMKKILDTIVALCLEDEKPGLGPKSQSHKRNIEANKAEVKVLGGLASSGMSGEQTLNHQPHKASKAESRDGHRQCTKLSNTSTAGTDGGTPHGSAASARPTPA